MANLTIAEITAFPWVWTVPIEKSNTKVLRTRVCDFSVLIWSLIHILSLMAIFQQLMEGEALACEMLPHLQCLDPHVHFTSYWALSTLVAKLRSSAKIPAVSIVEVWNHGLAPVPSSTVLSLENNKTISIEQTWFQHWPGHDHQENTRPSQHASFHLRQASSTVDWSCPWQQV